MNTILLDHNVSGGTAKVTALTGGGFAVAFQFQTTVPGISSVGVSVFDADGHSVGSTTSLGNAKFPHIAGLSDGKFVVQWSDVSPTSGDNTTVQDQVFNADGSLDGAAITVSDVTTDADDQDPTNVRALDNGDFISFFRQNSAQGTDYAILSDATACYCRGTQILTDRGEFAVEELRIRDLVVTVSGEARPIRWIGRRAYDGRFIAGNREVLPIRFRPGAIMKGVPARDLWVSPEHSLYIDNVLVQAKHLVNGVTVVQADNVDEIEYFHLELESHDIIYADGAAAETFVDCDNRLMFANGADYAGLYPNDERSRWQFCAPRLEWGSLQLRQIRSWMFARAELVGPTVDPRPDLHLVADGVTVAPCSVNGALYRFELPVGSKAVWLRSRSQIPAESDPQSLDTRRLGVPVARISLSTPDLLLEVQHSNPALDGGFHQDEASHRWTNGMAQIPEDLLCPFRGQITVLVQLAPGAQAQVGRKIPAVA